MTSAGKWPELLILWLEVKVVYRPGKVFGSFQFAFHERLVDDYLCCDIREFTFLPCFDLSAHGSEVPLHPVDPDGDAIDQ
jgi:hypothetical protein